MTARLRERGGIPDGEDLAQEVIARLLSTYGEAELQRWRPERLYGVAHRALHNAVVDLARRKPLEVLANGEPGATPSSVPVAHPAPDPESEVSNREMARAFLWCLGHALGEDERRFVEMSFALDSAPAARDRLGWPPDVVDKTKICHLRRRLVRRVLKCLDARLAPRA